MPYEITTKDGITIRNIPDGIAPDAQELKDRVAKIRAERQGGGQPALPSNDEIEERIRQREMGGVTDPNQPSTTAAGVAGAVTRGLAPVATGAMLGATLAAPTVVGTPAGAIAGAGAGALLQAFGDPIVGAINSALGTELKSPTAAMEELLTRIGVANPRTETERVLQAASAGAGGALGTAQLGKTLMQYASPLAQRVGQVLASQEKVQVASGVTGGASGQVAAEAEAGPVGQVLASVAGSTVPFTAARLASPASVVPPKPVPQTVEPPVAARPNPVQQQEAAAEVGDLIRKATSFSRGSTAAKEQLASLAKANPEAKAAAERLNIELPFDVFSDNPQIREAAGLTRSIAGSEASSSWQTTVRNAVAQADEVMKGLDANYVEGVPSTGAVSMNILDNLNSTRVDLKQKAEILHTKVENIIGKTTKVQLSKTNQTLSAIKEEVGEKEMSLQEKKLLRLATDPEATYGALNRARNLIGQAMERKESPYGNLEHGTLKRLYAALAEDQLTIAETIGGEELRKQLRGANLLTTKKIALDKRIIGAFGTESDGSVATVMQSAIKSASKGNAAQFNKLMKVVPDDLKRETVATALASVATSSRAAQEGAFGFAEFAKSYKGLRANPEVYSQIVKILGKDADKTLRDLYEVSRRITDARAQVLTTGKANQALVSNMKAENLIGKIMQSSTAQRAATGAAAIVPGGGFFAQDIIGFMNAKKDTVKAAGELFNSPQFQNLVAESVKTEKPNPSFFKKLATSKSFINFANKVNLPRDFDARVQWLQAAFQGGLTANNQQNEANQ